MLEKDKIGLVLALVRRNTTPAFCALVPQVGRYDHRFASIDNNKTYV